jgi:hypothetical protein
MGRVKYIETPEKLSELFNEYKQWVKDNPILIEDYVGQQAIRVDKKKAIPATFDGFEVWLYEQDIISDLGDYASNKDGRYSEYATIIKQIQRYCYVNNFNGAASGIFQQNIIARKLGLADSSEVTQKTVTVKVPGEDAS